MMPYQNSDKAFFAFSFGERAGDIGKSGVEDRDVALKNIKKKEDLQNLLFDISDFLRCQSHKLHK